MPKQRKTAKKPEIRKPSEELGALVERLDSLVEGQIGHLLSRDYEERLEIAAEHLDEVMQGFADAGA